MAIEENDKAESPTAEQWAFASGYVRRLKRGDQVRRMFEHYHLNLTRTADVRDFEQEVTMYVVGVTRRHTLRTDSAGDILDKSTSDGPFKVELDRWHIEAARTIRGHSRRGNTDRHYTGDSPEEVMESAEAGRADFAPEPRDGNSPLALAYKEFHDRLADLKGLEVEPRDRCIVKKVLAGLHKGQAVADILSEPERNRWYRKIKRPFDDWMRRIAPPDIDHLCY